MIHRMALLRLTVTWLALLLSGVRSAPCAGAVRHTVVQLPRGAVRQDQVYTDVNQDGLSDLIIATSGGDPHGTRALRVYFQKSQGPAFGMAPDHIIALTPDVIAYACADTDAHPGAEILLLTANACFGRRLQEDRAGRIFKMAECDFLWQLPDPKHAFSWQQAVQDFDGNGRPDVLLPQSGGLRILLQQDAGFQFTPLLTTPEDQRFGRSPIQVESDDSGTTIILGMEGLEPLFGASPSTDALVSIHHAVQVPQFTDWNGDGRSDIVTQTDDSLYVWRQTDADVLPHEPHLSLKLPIAVDAKKHYDPSRAQHVLDLNGDQCCDFILLTRDRDAKKFFTQILVYHNSGNSPAPGSLFGTEGIPTQLIKVAGLPGKAQLVDINSDGTPDLSFVLFRPDLLDQVKTVTSKSIKLEFLAYFNTRGRFSRTPDIAEEMTVSLQDEGHANFEPGRFWVDFDGDGLRDILVSDKKNHAALRLLRQTRRGIRLAKASVWEMTLPDHARLVTAAEGADEDSALLIVSSSQIDHVSFK